MNEKLKDLMFGKKCPRCKKGRMLEVTIETEKCLNCKFKRKR